MLQHSAPPNSPIVWDAKCCRKIMHPPKDQRRGYTIYGDALFPITPVYGGWKKQNRLNRLGYLGVHYDHFNHKIPDLCLLLFSKLISIRAKPQMGVNGKPFLGGEVNNPRVSSHVYVCKIQDQSKMYVYACKIQGQSEMSLSSKGPIMALQSSYWYT